MNHSNLTPLARNDTNRQVAIIRAGILLLAAVWGFTAWRRSADIVIDYGRELYVAWQMSEGALLYRDLWYYYGPLGATVNSLLFRMFGAGYDTLLVWMFCLIVLFSVALFEMFRRVEGLPGGTLAAAVFLNLFAFGHGMPTMNYNFLTPYSHEPVLGIYLVSALIAGFWLFWVSGRRRWLWVAGLAFAGTVFTKPEILLASVLVAAAGTVAGLVLKPGRPDWKSAAAFVLAALAGTAVPTLCSIWIHGGMEGFVAAHMAWLAVFMKAEISSSVSNLFFIGLSNPAESLARIVDSTVFLLAFCVPVAGLAWVERLKDKKSRAAVYLLGGLVLAVLIVWRFPENFGGFLVVTSPLILCFRWRAFLRASREGGDTSGRGLMLLWSVFGCAMLAKMILFPRISHYGFYLGLPATIDLALFLTGEIPMFIRRLGGNVQVARAGFSMLCAVVMLWAMILTSYGYGVVNYPVGSGRDTILTFDGDYHPRGLIFEEIRKRLEKDRPASLVVFPEGVLLNYLLRRPTGFKGFVFNPGEIAAYGQEKLLNELKANPPERVVFMWRPLDEFGFKRFGDAEGSGAKLLEWLRSNYKVRVKFGKDEHNPEKFALAIYQPLSEEGNEGPFREEAASGLAPSPSP